MTMELSLRAPRTVRLERKVDSSVNLAAAFFLGFVASTAYYHLPHLRQQVDTEKRVAVVEHKKAVEATNKEKALARVLVVTTGIPEDAVVPPPVRPSKKPPAK